MSITLFRLHPTLDELSDARHARRGMEGDAVRAEVAEHLLQCGRCQESMRYLESLNAGIAELSQPTLAVNAKTRMLAARAEGARAMLPVADPAPRTSRRLLAAASIAAVVALGAGSLLISGTHDVEAGTPSGTLTFSTSTPMTGQVVAVRYRPSARLSQFDTLQLRARLRSTDGRSYSTGMVAATVARLAKQKDGTYTGSLLLADSVVYAALAVEDPPGSEIDDNGGRTWELLRADSTGRVVLPALDQRTHDLMGRNWAEGFATARRMVKEYPDQVDAWSWLRNFQSWSGYSADSVRALHLGHVMDFDKRLRGRMDLSGEQVGQMYWYARSVDTGIANYWNRRMIRENANAPFVTQNRMFAVLSELSRERDTVRALARLDTLWANASAERQAQVASYATTIAVASRNSAEMRRWSNRILSGNPKSSSTVRAVASDFIRVPALRGEGLTLLRNELARLSQVGPESRALNETVAAQRSRLNRSRLATLAALGQGLVADGQNRAALDTLSLATSAGWDADVFRAVRTASLAAHDTATAVTMSARLVVDPRTSGSQRDSLSRFGVAATSASIWNTALQRERGELVRRTVGEANVRTVSSKVRVRALDGTDRDLRTMTQGKVTIVAFWSRFCQPAIEALPGLQRVAERVQANGGQVVTIVDEVAPSTELTTFLSSHKVAMPVYLDAAQEASRAFNQWGTPYFYLLDAKGRIVFDVTTDVDEVLLRADALLLSGSIKPAGSP